jgi:hypothetical protein
MTTGSLEKIKPGIQKLQNKWRLEDYLIHGIKNPDSNWKLSRGRDFKLTNNLKPKPKL